MKLYDIFPFFNELDLLELRFSELDALSPQYGLVELPRTFTDLPKPLYYQENKARFDNGSRKIRTYMPSAIPSGPHPTVDWFQRSSLVNLLHDAEPDDLVILSDVDEIPSREAIMLLMAAKLEHPVTLTNKLYYHRVDLQDPGGWLGSVVFPWKCINPATQTMQNIRDDRGDLPIMPNGGWHFSWLGDGEAISRKLQAVDIERESEIYGSGGIIPPDGGLPFLEKCYREGEDLFRRGRRKKVVPIMEGVDHPHGTLAWLKKYPQYGAAGVLA